MAKDKKTKKKSKLGVKIALIIAGIIVLIPVIAGLIFFKDIKTLMSVKKIDKGIYQMDCSYDYKLDKLMEADIGSYGEFISWADKELFYGMTSMRGNMRPFGCSSFAGVTQEGHHVFARNYDYSETDCLMIYTHPNNGYASIGFSDLGFLGLAGKRPSMSPDDTYGKVAMRLAPYVTCDGINEKGLGVSILMLDKLELHQDQGKDDILITVALRAILDKCATVDEAVDLLDNYDVHMAIGSNFHLFITDSTGRAVVAEWYHNELVITDTAACTNYYLCDINFSYNNGGDNRYETLVKIIEDCGGVMTNEDAMDYLSKAKQAGANSQTEWSAVYDLENFSVSICFDAEYDKVYKFDRKLFGCG